MRPTRASGRLRPLAFTVIGGLLVAPLLTLVFLSALYVTWFRIQPPESEPVFAPAIHVAG